MSMRATWTLFCDRCGWWEGQEDTASRARVVAQAAGFVRRRVDGKMVDLCPGCAKDVR